MNAAGKRLYIQNLARTGLKVKSCDGTGYSHDSVETARIKDKDFDQKCEAAMAVFRESLEEAAIDRAKEGWDEPVYQQGMMVGTKRKFSDRMLELLLKRHIPEFRDRATLDHNVNGGVLVVGDPQKTADEWIEKHGGEA